MREEIRKSRRNQGSLHGDFPEIWPLYCDHSVTSADARLRVGVEMFGIRRQEKKVSGNAAVRATCAAPVEAAGGSDMNANAECTGRQRDLDPFYRAVLYAT